MSGRDSSRIAAYYDRLVDRYGHDPRACDASGKPSLEVRYKVLSEVLDLTGLSVLEVGCGFGDLGAYLRKKFRGVKYQGIDISAKMIEEGRRVHPGLSLSRRDLMDMTGTFDVVLAQGIFYLLKGDAERKMVRMMGRMFALARRAAAFTAISRWSPRRSAGEFHADPARLLKDCRRLTPRLVLRHDYHPGDTAVYLYRQKEKSHGQK